MSLTPIAEHLEVELALPVLMTWVCNGQDSNTQSSLWRQTLLQTVWPLHSLIDYNFEVHLEKILIGIYVSHVLVINKSRYILSSKISQYWGVGVKRNCKSTLLLVFILIFFSNDVIVTDIKTLSSLKEQVLISIMYKSCQMLVGQMAAYRNVKLWWGQHSGLSL